MPEFDLRYIQAAKYTLADGKVKYAEKTKVGDAMTANLELKFAEGRLYAVGRLSEYMKLATGGTISLGVKKILDEAKKMLYGATEKVRQVGETPVTGILYSAKDAASYRDHPMAGRGGHRIWDASDQPVGHSEHQRPGLLGKSHQPQGRHRRRRTGQCLYVGTHRGDRLRSDKIRAGIQPKRQFLAKPKIRIY